MKLNWGHGITIFITGFILFMGFLVYKTFTIDFDLVAEDYYAKELAYEDRMQQMGNVRDLGETPTVELNSSQVIVSLPDSQRDGSSGTLMFYSPADKSSDREYTFEADKNGVFYVNTEQLPAQFYEVRVQWTNSGNNYYHTSDLHLTK
jgi:hypothetical protein